MPLRRFPSIARTLPVIGKERRMLTELSRRELLDRVRDRGVDARFPLRELGAIGNLLRERMFEGVLGLRVESLQVQELGVCQRMESGRQVSVAELYDTPEYWFREVLPDHRRRLQ